MSIKTETIETPRAAEPPRKQAPMVEMDPELLQALITDMEATETVKRYRQLLGVAQEYNQRARNS